MQDDTDTLETRFSRPPQSMGDAPRESPSDSASARSPVGMRTDPSGEASVEASQPSRYRELGVLGRGGMGEVLLVDDVRIGRLVAKKVIPDDVEASPVARARFVREARVQGQLEHPSIVPVYDFARDARGGEYFTMKRVTGLTLRQVLRGLADRDPDVATRFTRHRLLTAFQQVCLAIDYAHARGVVHRDLKPTNVMIGDFGEVYVLDWGIAKIGGVADSRTPSVVDGATDDTTRADDVLGTPGYMAPEQIRASADVDARADVFALGAILHQILAWQPLIAPGNPNATEVTERGLFEPRPSLRSLDPEPVPPELDAVCVAALALDPAERYPSARALHDVLETFLAGRRDIELRGALADEYSARAVAALDAPQARGELGALARGEAMRHAAHALAMDPTHAGAAHVMTRLLLEPPADALPEAEAALAQSDREVIVRNGRIACGLLLSFLVGVPMLWQAGMRSVFGYVGMYVPLVVAALIAGTFRLFSPRWFGVQLSVLSVALAITFATSSGLYGAFMLTPVFAQALISVGCGVPALGRHRATMVALGFASMVLPIALEWVGAAAGHYEFVNGDMIVHSGFVPLLALPVRTGLTCATTGAVLIAGTICWQASTDLAAQQRELHRYVWHLRQLIPASIGGAKSAPPRADEPALRRG